MRQIWCDICKELLSTQTMHYRFVVGDNSPHGLYTRLVYDLCGPCRDKATQEIKDIMGKLAKEYVNAGNQPDIATVTGGAKLSL